MGQIGQKLTKSIEKSLESIMKVGRGPTLAKIQPERKEKHRKASENVGRGPNLRKIDKGHREKHRKA